ncbi:MAG: phenylacetate--CoA ligase family protein [Betaproteobacteria bacterium]
MQGHVADPTRAGKPAARRHEQTSIGSVSWEATLAAEDFWRWTHVAAPVFASTHAPAEAVTRLAGGRYSELLRFARDHSPFYARHLRGLPSHPVLQDLPPTDRAMLMAGFDDWVTNRTLRRRALEGFIADPSRRGEPFMGRYAVWTSSGTSGVPGLYVNDPASLAIYEALVTARMVGRSGATMLWPILAGAGRLALVAAVDGHVAGVVSWDGMRRLHPWLALRSRAFSITEPIDRLVAQLNAWQPTLLSSYPSMLALLGEELAAGRLRIAPAVLWSGGEELAPGEAVRLKDLFGCPVVEEYGASECMSMAFSCEYGALHLNADWVILEPIDDKDRPVGPGIASADVLLTNLSNRVQPLIRYRLGDSITLLAGNCPCGCALPLLRVEGRRGDLIRLPGTKEKTVVLVPLALESVIEDGAGVHRFQILQAGENRLSVRLAPPEGLSRRDAWRRVRQCLQRFLEAHGAGATILSLDPLPPQPHHTNGKLHRVQGWADLPRD